MAARLAGLRARHEPGSAAGLVGGGRQQLDHVDAALAAEMATSRQRGPASDVVTLPDRDRDHVVAHAAARDHRHLERAVGGLDLDDVTPFDLELPGRGGADLGERLPRHLGDRIGDLLQPRQVRASPVVQHERGQCEQDELAGAV